MQEEEIFDLQEIWRIIRKRIYLITVITLLTTTAVGVISYFVIPPTYQSQTSVFIGDYNIKNDNYSQVNSSIDTYQKLMKTYLEIAKSATVAEKTVQKLDFNISPESVQSSVNIERKQDSQVLMITIKGKNPEQVYKIINAYAQAFIEEGKRMYTDGEIKIMDAAKLPVSPVSPNKKLNVLIGFFLGAMASIGLSFMIEFLDRTIKTEEDVERHLDMTVVGVILKQNSHNPKLITLQYPKSPISEAYRTLRTNIEFSSSDKEIQTIAVTSSNPGEGKSTTSINLAGIMAQTGKKVLLVDCDQRKPSVHEAFNLSNQKGVSNFLTGQATLDEIIINVENNLYVATSGVRPPNPAELLSSGRMVQFVQSIKEGFDYVIFDTPPVGIVTDAQILSQYVDGWLLVISSNETNREHTVKAKNLLQNVNARFIGVVLNKFDNKHYEYSNYYAYYRDDKNLREVKSRRKTSRRKKSRRKKRSSSSQ